MSVSCRRRIWSAKRRSSSSPPTAPRTGGKSGNGRGRSVMGARARSSTRRDFAELEARLGHAFRDPALLKRALSHSSAGPDSNERLEFFGDRVLGLVIAERLYEMYPEDNEGKL